jgi:Ca2+-binding RTX toxin-like protein
MMVNVAMPHGPMGAPVAMPPGVSLAEADFAQDGSDLVLTMPDGNQVRIEGYFDRPNPPSLASSDGAVVSGDVAVGLVAGVVGGEALGPIEGQVLVGTDGAAIGQVRNLSGVVFAIRPDGTRVQLEVGSQVFQGDVLESGADGAIGVMLADQTTFSMGENGKMVLDEMIYDPAAQKGSVSMSVVQGVFTFVSGQVAKTDPDAMSLKTPVATIGIRGTQVGIEIGEGKPMSVVLMEEKDGFVGEVVIANAGGVRVMNNASDFTTISSFNLIAAPVTTLAAAQLVNVFAPALKVIPLTGANQNDFGLQGQIEQGAAQAEFVTAAGPATPAAPAAQPVEAKESVIKTVAGDYVAAGERIAPVDVGKVKEAAITPPSNAPVLETRIEAVPQGTIKIEPVPTEPVGEPGVIRGTEGPDVLIGGADEDTLLGVGGADYLEGGAGDDMLSGGAGDDTLVGGAGTDTAVFTGNFADYTFTLGDDGVLTVAGPEGTDTVSGVEFLKFDDRTVATSSLAPEEPVLSVADVAGAEDTAIPLDISAVVSDPNEVLTVTVAGVPTGAMLSTGTDNGDGTWTLTADQLAGLTLTPPANYGGTLALTVTATSSESGQAATTAGTIAVNVTPVADVPVLAVTDATGAEDTAIPLNIQAAPTDEDETLIVTVSGVPAGATLSAGTDNGDGTWTLTTDQLAGLTLTPPEHAAEDFTLTVTAIATEANGDTATRTATLEVNVVGVADAPTLSMSVGEGEIAGDPVGSITLSVAKGGVGNTGQFEVFVDGVSVGIFTTDVAHGRTGGWDSITVEGLSLVPGQNPEVSIRPTSPKSNIYVDSISVNGRVLQAETAGSLTQGGGAVTDTYVKLAAHGQLKFTLGGDVLGGAMSFPVNIETTLVDADGSETLSVVVAGVPAGATLSAGTDNGDGTWTLAPDQLAGLTLTVPMEVQDNFSLSVAATATEADGDAATTTATADVFVPAYDEGGGDDIVGGPGADQLVGTSGDDVIYGRGGDDEIEGGQGDDTLYGEKGDDELMGGQGDDTLYGGKGEDTLYGDQGDDTLYGDSGDDTLIGGQGDDALYGGKGDDTLEGGQGDDVLTGGAGRDTFLFDAKAGKDVITDIMDQDKIVFEGKEFSARDMVFSENDEGDVVISFDGKHAPDTEVTLEGVSLNDISDSYTVTQSGDQVTVVLKMDDDKS